MRPSVLRSLHREGNFARTFERKRSPRLHRLRPQDFAQRGNDRGDVTDSSKNTHSNGFQCLFSFLIRGINLSTDNIRIVINKNEIVKTTSWSIIIYP